MSFSQDEFFFHDGGSVIQLASYSVIHALHISVFGIDI